MSGPSCHQPGALNMHPRLVILDVPEAPADGSNIAARGWSIFQRRPQSLSPCTHCTAQCCSLSAQLTVVEALAIIFGLGLAPQTCVRLRPRLDGDPLAYQTPIKLEDGHHMLFLQKTGDYCTHLVRPGQPTSRCGIYGLRPAICRMYPYSFTLDGTAYKAGNQSFCQVSWLQNEQARTQLQADALEWRKDVAQDKQLVGKWNRGRRVRTQDAFFHHMVHTMGPALGYDPAVLAPLPPPMKLT